MDSSQPLAPAQAPIPSPTPEASQSVEAKPVAAEAAPAQAPVAAQPAPQATAQPAVTVPEIKAQGPEFFGYRPAKWASDFEFVRNNKGKGDTDDAKTWLLFLVDRLLKKHSV